MSSGRDCWLEETSPGSWIIALENDEGTRDDPEYDEIGPISGTLKDVEEYIRRNLQNPGGYAVAFHANSTDPSR